jgi:hypothetical protein
VNRYRENYGTMRFSNAGGEVIPAIPYPQEPQSVSEPGILNHKTENHYDRESGALTINCFRNDPPSNSELKYTLAAYRKRGTVKRLTLILDQSLLINDLNVGVWLQANRFDRDLSMNVSGGALAFSRTFPQKGHQPACRTA